MLVTAYSQKPFIEFLRARRLTDNLQHFVLYAIAMKTEDTPTEEVPCPLVRTAIMADDKFVFAGSKGL